MKKATESSNAGREPTPGRPSARRLLLSTPHGNEITARVRTLGTSIEASAAFCLLLN